MTTTRGSAIGDPTESVTAASCHAIVDELFHPPVEAGQPGAAIGVEIEYFTATAGGRRPDHQALVDLFPSPLRAGGQVTVEPGSQIELSTAPHRHLTELLTALDTELDQLGRMLGDAGIDHWSGGIDLRRPPERTCRAPRYRFMEAELDAFSRAGRWMMTNTASLQVNVANCPDDPPQRWRLLSRVGPLLTAMFANSPGRSSDGTAWCSLRQGCWLAMDPRRADLPATTNRGARDDYARYALAAPVLFIDEGDGGPRAPPPGLTFNDWLLGRPGLRPPREQDFRYHLTTLFPPVRPRGWLEVRCIDALDRPLLDVAVAVVAALCSPAVAGEVELAIDPPPSYLEAARFGLAEPRIRNQASRLLAIAIDHARHHDWPVVADLEAFTADVVAGRSPAAALPATTGHLRPPLERAHQ